MERRSTALKGVSVMLLAIMMGVSCKKDASMPIQQQENQLQQEAAVSASNMVVSSVLYDMNGKNIGRTDVKLEDEESLASVYVEIASSVPLTAVILEPDGNTFARLDDIKVPQKKEYETSLDANQGTEGFASTSSSFTFPVLNDKTGNRITFDGMFAVKGRYILLKYGDKVIAKGMLQ